VGERRGWKNGERWEKMREGYKIYETLYLKSPNYIKPGSIFKKFGVLVSELLDLSTKSK
jgi:hypothetical protein